MLGWRRHIGRAAAALMLGCLSLPAAAAPALWRVSDGDSAIWIFGAVHVLDQPRQWRSPAFDMALTRAREVWFEMVLDTPAIATITRLSITEGYYRDGTTLWSHLDADEVKRVEAAIDAVGLSRDAIGQMRPWLASTTLGGTIGGGMASLAGVEMTVTAEVPPARQHGLETAEEQFALIGGQSDADQISDLLDTADALAAHKTGESITGDLYEDWISGDQLGLGHTITSGLGAPGSKVFDRMIGDRNRRWLPEAERLLKTNVPAIMIVGAGHLVGPVGLPALLGQAGYTVTRVEDEGAAALDGPRMGTGLPR
jgi:uncharacterized protein YbaP (TraB family)